MIVWCQRCGAEPIAREGVVVDPPICVPCFIYERLVEAIRRPIDTAVLYGPRYEYNTVDLKQLRRERLDRRWEHFLQNYR